MFDEMFGMDEVSFLCRLVVRVRLIYFYGG